jgi:two-component system OmpR family response regulator
MRILVAEDEPKLAQRICARLSDAGFVVDVSHDGKDAQFLGSTETYDAVVLDLGLPGLDGLSVLEQWREAGVRTPVLVLTARGRWHEKLAGFNAGADDYVTKPFEMDEVVVRLNALIRRSAGHATPTLTCGPLAHDPNSGRFTLDGEPLELTAQEYRILAYLMLRQGQIVSRTELYEHVYDRDAERDSNVLDVLLSRIRRKVGTSLIVTVRGRGFLLSDDAQTTDE